MVIAVEHAGAERRLLILPHGEEFRIAAEARTGRDGVEVRLQDALVTPSDWPDSLLRCCLSCWPLSPRSLSDHARLCADLGRLNPELT